MDIQKRAELQLNSKVVKKWEEINKHAADIQSLIDEEVQKLEKKCDFVPKESEEEENLESQMKVCVRTRPLLKHEQNAEYLPVVHTSNPHVLVTDPVARSARTDGAGFRLNNSIFDADMAFGPDDDNELVYTSIIHPLLETASKGGIGTMFAYGQTGSGKTHTVSGVITRLSQDLFTEKNKNVSIFLTYVQLLGNTVTDLLVEDFDSEADSEEEGNKKRNSNVGIMEDKFGKVCLVGAKEVEIMNEDDFLTNTNEAQSRRSTSVTFKNDTSSRSHAVCKLTFRNKKIRTAEDGQMFLIDLAGSENAADSQFHDRSRIQETKDINKSLMCLKDCIRNRAKAASDPSTFVHIPYRQSKLSHLLKDAFELESYKPSKTVVIANVAPTYVDLSMTLNTLRYVAPIKQGLKNRTKIEPDLRNPEHWSNEKLCDWISNASKGKVKVQSVCPWETGRQFLSLPESEILSRLMQNKMSEKDAKAFYIRLWKMFIDSKTKERRDKMRPIRKQRNLKSSNPRVVANGVQKTQNGNCEDEKKL